MAAQYKKPAGNSSKVKTNITVHITEKAKNKLIKAAQKQKTSVSQFVEELTKNL